ncbi:MAG: hypothetical protein LBE36_12445 [Flavobacteriaceae bacterium]|jgi:hypothetical protein|nr:hypothetical protein [Flavobacteriaceae bacterium]
MQEYSVIHKIGDTYIRLDKIVAIKLSNHSSRGATNIVKLILTDDLEPIEVEFKDYDEAKKEVEALILRMEEYYFKEKKRLVHTNDIQNIRRKKPQTTFHQ